MTYEIKLTVTVKYLKDEMDSECFGNELACHILDTFNDDDSISPIVKIESVLTSKHDKK